MNIESAIREILPRVTGATPFPNTNYPCPLNLSLLGKVDINALKRQAQDASSLSLEHQLILLMTLAEASEASQPDRETFFINDSQVRAYLLRLNASTGWALIWGDDDPRANELMSLLQREQFVLFGLRNGGAAPPKQVKDLGSRPTSVVYFYQMLVRYAHIYGRIPLGDDHEVGEFIQDNGPGVMFLLKENLTPLEEALFVGGLLLGIPAVVPSSFKLPYGQLLAADEPKEMVEKAPSLPTLRTRQRLHFTTPLPFRFDASFATEEIKDGKTIGGTPVSSFIVTNADKGEGIEIIGDAGADVGIEIAIGDPRVDVVMTDYLEEFAARLPAYIEGVAAEMKAGCPAFSVRPGIPFEPAYLAQACQAGLKAHFNIAPVKIRLVFKPEMLPAMQQEAEAFRNKRKQALAAASEETEPNFVSCTRCHSFALEHTCIVTPERPSICGTRTWSHLKTRASLSHFDAGGLAKRNAGQALQALVKKGARLDGERGEYEGTNAAMTRLTENRTKRVFLHSIFGSPHTCCSCFQSLAFYLPEVDAIGIMERASKGLAPDGRSWDDLANTAAGKQTPGITGCGRSYLKSAKFLRGDGGWNRVVWMSKKLKDEFAKEKAWIATEEDVHSLAELEDFLAKAPRPASG